MKKLYIMGLVLFFIIVLLFVYLQVISKPKESILERYNLDASNLKELIEDLNTRDNKPLPFSASITATKLIISDKYDEIELDISNLEFYVSVAPYIDSTHPCFHHSLSGCMGELKNKEIAVVVTDKDGNIVFDEIVKTSHNGFAGIWLPRNIEGTITVTYDRKVGSLNISTSDNSATCLTELKLL